MPSGPPTLGVSFWLGMASFCLTAIVVQPGLGALVAMGVNLVLLFALRFTARREGLRAGRMLSAGVDVRRVGRP